MPGADNPSERAGRVEPALHLSDDLHLIEAAVRGAGEIALSYTPKAARSWLKAGNSPVTEADMASDKHLHDTLTVSRPGYGWISEESRSKPAAPGNGQQRTFVVDPIDGTRGFMDGGDEWTICVAILQDGVPVVGVVYNPTRDEMFGAVSGGGARCNDAAISVSRQDSLTGARLAASKKAVRTLGKASSEVEARYVPSLAYRVAGVASGVYDGTISTGRAHIWDIAAPAVIVAEAGGLVTDSHATGPDYTAQDCRVPPLVVAGPELHPLLCAALQSAPGQGQ